MAVSNHDTIIATTMTGHVARAYPASDICWDAPKRTTIPGDNFIPTTMLGTGKTTKTLIDGASVWTAAGLIDAAPSDPAHAGVGGGTLSTTYRKEASPFTYSKDVKFEGKGVVRTDDRTQQNHKNCFGFVDDSNVTGQVAAASDYLKKKCTFDTLKGVCKHGRELGSPPNAKPDEAFFLDVLAEDEVTLTSTRKDLDKNAPSDCKDHTYWGATRAGQGPGSRLDHIGDEFVVKGGVMADPYTGQITEMKKPAEGPDTGDEKRYAEDKKATQAALKEYGGSATLNAPRPSGKSNLISQTAPTGPGVVQSVADARTREYNEAANKAVNARAALTAIKNVEKAIALWLIEREPPVVNVSAIACGGAKHVKLRVFPKDPFKFDLFTEALNAKLKLIRDMGKIVEFITGKFGVTFTLKFLESPTFTLEIAYKELTQDKNNYVKTQVRKAWSLVFSFNPFFEVGAKFTIPLLPLLAAVASPVVAKAAQWLLDKAGVQINAFAEIKMTLNPSINATRDEYDDGYCSGPMATLVVTFSIGLEAKIGSWGAAEVRGYLEGKLWLESWKFAPAPALVQADLKGSLQLGIKGFIKVSKWGWEKSFDFDWRPEGGKFPGKDANNPGRDTSIITTLQLSVK